MAAIGTRREFITKISSSTPFTIQKFQLNPAQQGTFPWLSDLVQNFEYYQFGALRFIYRALSADALNSTNTALGVVMMGCIYDSVDATFGSSAEMYNYQGTISAKPSQNMIYAVSNLGMRRYTRPGAQPSNTDIRMYDVGNFFIATEGSQANAVVGELWVEYDVYLTVPKLIGDLGTDVMGVHYYSTAGPITTTAPLGSAYSTRYDNLGATLSVGGNQITFPSQPKILTNSCWKITMLIAGTAAVPIMTVPTLTNCQLISNLKNGTNGYSNTYSGSNPEMTIIILVRITSTTADARASVVFNFTAIPTSATSCDLFIDQMPPI